ncbi:alpha/beta hydrolase [Legionella micdadei]|nr:alpha/beta hydrolase [Legionella micdadei]
MLKGNIMTAKPISFENQEGLLLQGILEISEKSTDSYAIFAHCFTCSKNSLAASRISRALARKGINVLRFDFTGLGDSSGNFSETNFTTNINDLTAAFRFLQEQFCAPKILIGHSLGGAAVLASLNHLPQIDVTVTIGAPAYAKHVTQNFNDKLSEIIRQGKTEVTLGGKQLTLTRQFLDDLARYHSLSFLRKIKTALLICHSPLDEIVAIENAQEIFKAAKHPKSFLSLGDADHLISKQVDANLLADVIAAWSTRWVKSD